MKRTLVVLLGLVLLASIVVAAQVAVTPIEIEGYRTFYFFNNETGKTATKISIMFDQEVVFDAADILAFGGGVPTMVAISTSFAFIDVEVVPGGTLQLVLPAEYIDAKVTGAFWFE